MISIVKSTLFSFKLEKNMQFMSFNGRNRYISIVALKMTCVSVCLKHMKTDFAVFSCVHHTKRFLVETISNSLNPKFK